MALWGRFTRHCAYVHTCAVPFPPALLGSIQKEGESQAGYPWRERDTTAMQHCLLVCAWMLLAVAVAWRGVGCGKKKLGLGEGRIIQGTALPLLLGPEIEAHTPSFFFPPYLLRMAPL